MLFQHNFDLSAGKPYSPTEFHMPVHAKRAPAAAVANNWYTNLTFDNFAPGVREGIAAPTAFAQTAHRTNLLDGNGAYNSPAPINFEAFGDFISNPVAQRRAQFWWEAIRDNRENLDSPGFFQNTGTWNAPPTGRTAQRYITAASTRTSIAPLH